MKMPRLTLLTLLISTGLIPSAVADEAAVRKTLAAYVGVINEASATKAAEFWRATGTHLDHTTGQKIVGREAIQNDLQEIFEASPKMKLSATIESVKMVTPTVARVAGETTLVMPDDAPAVSSYTALLVKENGRWLLDNIEEMPTPVPSSTVEALGDLAWLIGNWVDDSDSMTVSTTFRWTANKAFLLRSFEVADEQGVALTGTQIIGWDPVQQQVRGWSFNSDGSFGESRWVSEESGWRAKTTQTLAGGSIASGTYVLKKLDDNAFTMELVGHELDGVPQPAGEAVKIVRAESGSAAANNN